MLPRIFELFVQANHASTKAEGGLGIGLTLVKSEEPRGDAQRASRPNGSLGQGSESTVWLPLSARWLDPARDHVHVLALQGPSMHEENGTQATVSVRSAAS